MFEVSDSNEDFNLHEGSNAGSKLSAPPQNPEASGHEGKKSLKRKRGKVYAGDIATV